MAEFKLKVDSILGGQSSVEYLAGNGQFQNSTAIDPDRSANSSNQAGGVITPVAYAEFSSTEIDGTPIAIITTPKDALTYVVTDNGKLISYTTAYTSGASVSIGTVTGNEAHGATYYNNFIYIFGTGASNDDVSRYGPLDGTPVLTNGVWKGATLGTQTALGNPTYPTLNSVEYPTHWGHVHVDNQLYFGDFDVSSGTVATQGKGLIHSIKTKKGTDEGDTDDGSAYNVLDLPFGYLPTDIESYGTDLIISAIQTSDNSVNQGPASLFLWDTTDVDSFYRQVDLEDPMISALLNDNGLIRVFSGTGVTDAGHAVGTYDGAYGVRSDAYFDTGYSPFAGAVLKMKSRILWGTQSNDAELGNAAVLRSLGYKHPDLPSRAKHNVVRATAGTNPMLTAAARPQQSSGLDPQYIVGHKDDSAFGVDKIDASAAQRGFFTSETFHVGSPFVLTKLKIPLSGIVDSTTAIKVRIRYDNGNLVKTLATINNTNNSGQKNIIFKREELNAATTTGILPEQNFFIELVFNSTNIISVLLPIEITLDVKQD